MTPGVIYKNIYINIMETIDWYIKDLIQAVISYDMYEASLLVNFVNFI